MRDEVGRILGVADRLRMMSRPLHRDMTGEVRWNAQEARRTRDGIDIATLGLDRLSDAPAPVLRSLRRPVDSVLSFSAVART